MGNASSLTDGGYDSGYASCPCFWGKLPGSLIRDYLKANSSFNGCRVLDLGCGEGKNAFAFASAGAVVDAVDCSARALANGQKAFTNPNICWIHSDAVSHLTNCTSYDLVIMYGLLHCLPTVNDISRVLDLAIGKTKRGGTHLIVSFNDGPHDLSAHPNFRPTLISHESYLALYRKHRITSAQDAVIHESHPNNNVRHFHSITRLTVDIIHELS